MAWGKALGPVTKSAGPIATIGRRIWFIFIIIFMVLVLLKSFTIILETGDPYEGVKYLGLKFAYPVLSIHENGQEILNNNKFIIDGSLWKTLLTYSDILSSLFMISLWIIILKFIALHFILWDRSKTSSAYFIALIGFFVLQPVALALTGQDPRIVWYAMKTIFQVCYHIFSDLFSDFGDYGDKFVKGLNITNGTNISTT